MQFKPGDRVEWTGSEGTGEKGTVTVALSKRFEVKWDKADEYGGDTFTYEDRPGSCVRKSGTR